MRISIYIKWYLINFQLGRYFIQFMIQYVLHDIKIRTNGE